MQSVTVGNPQAHALEITFPGAGGSIRITPEGEVEFNGTDVTESAQAFWVWVRTLML